MFVFLSALAGLLGFAVAGFAAGLVLGSGPVQSHALSATIVGGLFALYFAPVGLLSGLVGSLVLRERSAKKMTLILVLCFLATAIASFAYFHWQTFKRG